MSEIHHSQKPSPGASLAFFGFSLLLALSGAALVSFFAVYLPGSEAQQLVFLMSGTGIATTLFAYLLYRSQMILQLGSLRWTLLLIILCTVALISLQMNGLAHLMFIDSYYLSITLMALSFSALTALSFSFFVARTMTERLSLLIAAAQRVAAGELTTRLDVRGRDEIAQLATAFNSMAEALESAEAEKRVLEQARRDLIAWVSHDLRTPLASMRVMIEAMADGVVHDEETMRMADWLLDLGPGAGEYGGRVVAEGTPEEVMEHPDSLTGAYLSGRLRIDVPAQRRPGNGQAITVRGATENNLKNINVSIPLGKFVCITGVSGSGKSTLMIDILYRRLAQVINGSKERPGQHAGIDGIEHIDKIINIDQSPIGRTPRSNPGTYTKMFDAIRSLFAELPESKIRGYTPGRFSFNVKGGRCENCQGQGVLQIEMQFLPDIYVTCDVCNGARYNRETLQVHYKGKSIAQVLDMTVQEGLSFFGNIPTIIPKLETLDAVGLGYIRIGQPATTLSGGEAQRIKLSRELSKRATGQTLYILDEPSTGLHAADVKRLIDVLQQLVDNGNTVLVIEHNLDIIKVADHLIDLGPEGGDAGGEIIAEGTPEAVALVSHSYTGQYLRPYLQLAEPAAD